MRFQTSFNCRRRPCTASASHTNLLRNASDAMLEIVRALLTGTDRAGDGGCVLGAQGQVCHLKLSTSSSGSSTQPRVTDRIGLSVVIDHQKSSGPVGRRMRTRATFSFSIPGSRGSLNRQICVTGQNALEAKLMETRPLLSVVDDDESVRESLPDLLKEFGFAAGVSSAEEFLVSVP